MARAVIYARYSSHSQSEASITDQVRICTEAAERDGDTIVKVYAEPAKSGTDAVHRPVFLRMIADAAKGGFSKLYIYKQDRFARNRFDSANYKRKLRKAGVSIVSVMEPSVDGPEAILLEGMLESYAEYYSASLAVVVKRGMDGNALLGKHNGVKVYGYDLGKDGFYHVNEDEAAVVRMVFKMVDAGHSLTEVMQALEPYRTKRGKHFVRSRVTYMLRNPKYKGTYSFDGHEIEGGMEAIVSPDLFDRVQGKVGKRRKKTAHEYALSGKLFDKDGNRFIGACARGKAGKTYVYYQVNKTGERHPRDEVEGAVYSAVAAFLSSDPKLRRAIGQGVIDIQSEALRDEVSEAEAMRGRLRDIDREADNLVDSIAKLGARDRLTDKLAELEDERAALEAELFEVERSAPKLSLELVMAAIDSIIALKAPMTIVESFVSEVIIDGEWMTVIFNVGEPPDRDSKTPARGRCSSRFKMVDQMVHDSNTIRVEVSAWSFSIVFKWR